MPDADNRNRAIPLEQTCPVTRFIANVSQPIWDDGNVQFYGLADDTFTHIIEQVAFSHDWHLITTPSAMSDVYLLVRRAPIVDTVSGEALVWYRIIMLL